MRELKRLAQVVLIGAASLAQRPGLADDDVYERFNRYCREHFGAEKEPLAYRKSGDKLLFIIEGQWRHVSENSAVVAWETNLPAVSYIEFGETPRYGRTTPKEERAFYLHVHYLKDLQPGKTYHYRLVSVDERGNKLTSDDRRISPRKVQGAIRIPGNLPGPPYRLDRPGTYLLTADVEADVTGIDILASGVTLDLNGHTITYDKSQHGYEAVKDTEAFQAAFGPKPNGGPHGIRGSYGSQSGGVRIFNGVIRQGAGGHAMWSAPITTPSWDEVAGVTLIYHGPQVRGIEGEVRDLHHNVFLDLGTEVPDRHQGTTAIEHGVHAHRNLIKRSRHRGIDGVDNGKVYSNEIYIDSFATNSYGVLYYKTRGATCSDNRIFGAGYHFIGVGTVSDGVGDIKVSTNYIHARTLERAAGRGSEYGDQSGANGLRVTWGGENIEWANNVVVVEGRGAADGEVRAVWHVPDENQSNLIYRDNVFKAVADPQKKAALGAIVVCGGADVRKVHAALFRNNVVISDFANVCLGEPYYGDGANGRFEGNTFVGLRGPNDYRTIQGGVPNGDRSSRGHYFVDSKFEGIAGYDRVNWRGDGDFSVGWTTTIKVAPKAAVVIEDAAGREEFRGNADARGLATVVLTQYRQTDAGKTSLTPHRITVSNGNTSATRSITADRPQTIEF